MTITIVVVRRHCLTTTTIVVVRQNCPTTTTIVVVRQYCLTTIAVVHRYCHIAAVLAVWYVDTVILWRS